MLRRVSLLDILWRTGVTPPQIQEGHTPLLKYTPGSAITSITSITSHESDNADYRALARDVGESSEVVSTVSAKGPQSLSRPGPLLFAKSWTFRSLHQQHSFGLHQSLAAEPVEVDTAGDLSIRIVPTIPGDHVRAGRLLRPGQRADGLSLEVVDGQRDVAVFRQLVGYGGRWVKGVGVILPKDIPALKGQWRVYHDG